MSTRIVLAADHGGVELKNEFVRGLRSRGYEVTDLGTHTTDATDYPPYAHAVARGIKAGNYDLGVLVCGTGVGMAIAANRHPSIRAVNCTDTFTARMSRTHNHANVLALGARVVGWGLAWDILNAWLETPESPEERHVLRVGKIEIV